MSKIKNSDITSLRGQRQVAIGLTTPEGRAQLKSFDFNSNAQMSSVLRSDFTLNPASGEVNIVDLIPNHDLGTPGGATHVSFIARFLNLDFSSGDKELQVSPVVNLPINGVTSTVTLTPTAAPTGTGNQLYFLKVAFFQEVNSIQYLLKNGAFNALQLIEVL